MLKPTSGTEIIAKRNQSKYDFVKVRVWVEDHVYVLSRYLVCRALVSTKVRDEWVTQQSETIPFPAQINAKDAVQISLDLKRVRYRFLTLGFRYANQCFADIGGPWIESHYASKWMLDHTQWLTGFQEEFEDFLYKTMIVFGYGEAHVARYRMMTTYESLC